MSSMVMERINRCDKEETEVEFTVQGRKVIGIFPTGDNFDIYQQIKHMLINSYMKEKCSEIREF